MGSGRNYVISTGTPSPTCSGESKPDHLALGDDTSLWEHIVLSGHMRRLSGVEVKVHTSFPERSRGALRYPGWFTQSPHHRLVQEERGRGGTAPRSVLRPERGGCGSEQSLMSPTEGKLLRERPLVGTEASTSARAFVVLRFSEARPV